MAAIITVTAPGPSRGITTTSGGIVPSTGIGPRADLQGNRIKFTTRLIARVCNLVAVRPLIATSFVARSCELDAVVLGGPAGRLHTFHRRPGPAQVQNRALVGADPS